MEYQRTDSLQTSALNKASNLERRLPERAPSFSLQLVAVHLCLLAPVAQTGSVLNRFDTKFLSKNEAKQTWIVSIPVVFLQQPLVAILCWNKLKNGLNSEKAVRAAEWRGPFPLKIGASTGCMLINRYRWFSQCARSIFPFLGSQWCPFCFQKAAQL